MIVRKSWFVIPLLAACAGHTPPVRIAGDPVGLAHLAGQWVGEYANPETGRSGSIVFTLLAGEDHAHGDVLMVPRGSSNPVRAARPEGLPDPEPGVRALNIEVVLARGDTVTGTLAPFVDPDCQCAVSTVFTGVLRNDTISGTFVSRRARVAVPSTGTWRVERRR